MDTATLTNVAIRGMEPGLEMDLWVATRVLGWRIVGDTAYSPSGSANDATAMWDGPRPRWLPDYSTDIAAAFEVVKKIPPSDMTYFRLMGATAGWQVWWPTPSGKCNGYGATAHLAICRAALLSTLQA